MIEDVFRKRISFSSIEALYTEVRPRLSVTGEVEGVEVQFKLYLARKDRASPPLIILDRDGYVTRKKLELPLAIAGDTEVGLLSSLPKAVKAKIIRVASLWLNDEFEDFPHLLDTLRKEGILVTPVPALKDISFLKEVDWHTYVENLLNFKAVKIDPRLKIVRACTTVRGIVPALNCNTINAFPGQTGRSDYYKLAGEVKDKVTANSLIGYAKSGREIYIGSIDGTELPIAIDQIESQGAFELLRYLYNIMETGEAVVDSGGVSFRVWSKAPLIFIANPIGYSTQNLKSFWALIEHLGRNPALGRRFGIILYDKQAVRLEGRASSQDLNEWAMNFQLFRAIEEYALKELKKIYSDQKVWAWCNERVDAYVKEGLKVIEPLKEKHELLYTFLHEFIVNGTSHTKGGALSASVLYNLKYIALKSYTIEDILRDAEEFLSDVLEINLDSLRRIVENYQEEKALAIPRIFESLPTYLKEIISALELYRRYKAERGEELEDEVLVRDIPYTPSNYDYITQAIKDALKSKANPERHNGKLREYFKLEIVKRDDLYARYLSKTPIKEIAPLGNFGKKGIREPISNKYPSSNEGTNLDVYVQKSTLEEQKHMSENGSLIPEIPEFPKIKESRIIRLEELDQATTCELCGKAGASYKLVFGDGHVEIVHHSCALESYPELKGEASPQNDSKTPKIPKTPNTDEPIEEESAINASLEKDSKSPKNSIDLLPCPHCTAKFASEKDLRSHVQAEHGGEA